MGREAFRSIIVAAAILCSLVLSCGALAHDIPNDVTLHAFLKPQRDNLFLLVRVPLMAMRDIDLPLRGPGYLDLARAETKLSEAATLWLANTTEVYENDSQLPKPRIAAQRVSLESDKSFVSYAEALNHVNGPRLPDDTQVVWSQLMLDVLFEYPIKSERSEFSIRLGVGNLALRVVTVLRFLPPSGAIRAFEFSGDPGLVRLDPRWHQTALRFVKDGLYHILDGSDHLLFLFCLVIPFRRFRALVPIVTAFTVEHSITLIASAYGLTPGALWFPPLIETLIALSVFYMAIENIVGAGTVQRRWLIAFAFGLVHGFGFSFALQQTLQFAGAHLLTSLLSFNLGVEIGQLLVLLLCIPLLEFLFRHVIAERVGTIVLSALVAHTAWHWLTERGEKLRQYRVQWPALTSASLASCLHWLMLAIAVVGLLWFVPSLMRERAQRRAERNAAPTE
jgi:hypothetical protein